MCEESSLIPNIFITYMAKSSEKVNTPQEYFQKYKVWTMKIKKIKNKGQKSAAPYEGLIYSEDNMP